MQITPSRIETCAPLWITSYRRSPSVSWPSSELRRRSRKCFSGWSSELLEPFFPLAVKGSRVERNSSLTPASTAHSFRSCCGLFLPLPRPPLRRRIGFLAPRRDSGLKLKLGIRVADAVNPQLSKINPTFHTLPSLSSCCTCPCGWQDPRCASCLCVAC